MSDSHENNPVVARPDDLPAPPRVWPVAVLAGIAVFLSIVGIARYGSIAQKQAALSAHVSTNTSRISNAADARCGAVRLQVELPAVTPFEKAMITYDKRVYPTCLKMK